METRASSNLNGAAISELRKARGWNRERLAFGASCTVDYIAKLERGERPITGMVLYRLSKAFGLSVEKLERQLSNSAGNARGK
jgi:transcriptional regulator with XRE-family HTH domain